MGALSPTQQQPVDAAAKILGSKGKQLRTHEIHIRRTAAKGKYIARHDLRDSKGNPPQDGQRDSAEYPLGSEQEMLAHVQQHMAEGQPGQQPEDDEQQ
jgi:hypothetical protein